jgi:uncharacterized protein (TIGR02118 family)
MATAKILLIFPRPSDEAAFEQVFRNVHLPMLEKQLAGLNRFAVTRVVDSVEGPARAYRISEAHFSDSRTLHACLDSAGAKQVFEQAKTMSTGGPPIILVCDEESHLVW